MEKTAEQLQAEEQARQARSQAFLSWKEHPVTARYFQFLAEKYEELKEDWAKMTYVGATPEITAQSNHHALGEATILRDLINLEAEDLEPNDEQ